LICCYHIMRSTSVSKGHSLLAVAVRLLFISSSTTQKIVYGSSLLSEGTFNHKSFHCCFVCVCVFCAYFYMNFLCSLTSHIYHMMQQYCVLVVTVLDWMATVRSR